MKLLFWFNLFYSLLLLLYSKFSSLFTLITSPGYISILIEKKKKLLNRPNEINEEEIPSKLDQYRSVEDNNIITYDNNNNEISTQEQNALISETSSYNSNATSRFSRFTNYTFMSFSRIGNNIVNAKNCVMNKFRRNAYYCLW